MTSVSCKKNPTQRPKAKNKNTKTRCEICSKPTPKRRVIAGWAIHPPPEAAHPNYIDPTSDAHTPPPPKKKTKTTKIKKKKLMHIWAIMIINWAWCPYQFFSRIIQVWFISMCLMFFFFLFSHIYLTYLVAFLHSNFCSMFFHFKNLFSSLATCSGELFPAQKWYILAKAISKSFLFEVGLENAC